MPILATVTPYGVICVDKNKNILWEWTVGGKRIYGLDVDPETGNLYLGFSNKVIEVTRAGSKVWEYSHKEMKGLHSVQYTPDKTLLCACALNDRVLEISKKRGLVWKWWAGDQFEPPEDYENFDDWRSISRKVIHQWTHLNHAWRMQNGHTLITFYKGKTLDVIIRGGREKAVEEYQGMVMRVDPDGVVQWTWGKGKVKHPHYIVPYRDGYLVADTVNERVCYVTEEEGLIKSYPVSGRPHGIEVTVDGFYAALGPTRKILKLKNGKKVWIYSLTKKSQRQVFAVRWLPTWSAEYNKEEEKQVKKYLKKLGYL